MKKVMSTLLVLAVCATAFVNVSCDKDEQQAAIPVAQQFDGSYQSIEQFVTPQLLQTMQDMGLQIHDGGTPPNLEGTYLMAPSKLQSSNRPGDVADSSFADLYMTFSNQDNSKHTVDFSYDQPSAGESGVGTGTYVSGDGALFSSFMKQTTTYNGHDAETIMIVSGKITAQGFTEVQQAVFMVNNGGYSGYIDNGQGRIFYDGDGLVEKQ